MIDKANALGGLRITKNIRGGHTGDIHLSPSRTRLSERRWPKVGPCARPPHRVYTPVHLHPNTCPRSVATWHVWPRSCGPLPLFGNLKQP
jgi:hypothetical protein